MGNEPVQAPRSKRRSVVEAEPAPTLDPSRLPGPNARRGFARLPAIDLGEVGVGSRRWFDVCDLIVADGFRGHAAVLGVVAEETFLAATNEATSTSGPTNAFDSDAFPQRVISTDELTPLRVRFGPSEPGTYQATIAYRADWTDRRVDQTAVRISARAVRPDQLAPEVADRTSRDLVDNEQSAKDVSRASLVARDQLGVATTEATNAANALGKAQAQGVTNAEKEAKSFKQPTPEAAWWAALAEIAISMGTATIAGIVARKITDHVTVAIGKSVKDVKDMAPYYGTIDAIKDGVKATRRAVAPQPGAAKKTPPAPEPNSVQGTYSSNNVIDFWAEQGKRANDYGDAQSTVVADTQAAMLALVDVQPATSVAIMRSLRDVFKEAKEHATIEQQVASESQWVAGIARGSLEGAREERTSTALDPVLEDELYRQSDGIVRIFVSLDEHAESIEDASFQITGAKVNGISQEIADQLSTRPLAQFPMPVLIELAPGAYGVGATIRREADGSLHATGALPYVSATNASVVRTNVIAHIAQKVLSKPIADVKTKSSIVSNDASRDRDP
jgi:hypothetical protein